VSPADLLLYAAMALLAGAMAPVQAGMNVQLRQHLGGPEAAALVSFLVGTVALAGFVLLGGKPFHLGTALQGAPLWAWLGGLLGAYFVACAVILAPKLGAGTMMALFVAGQMLASLWLDHYGLLGFAVRTLTPLRVLGAVLVVLGVILIRR